MYCFSVCHHLTPFLNQSVTFVFSNTEPADHTSDDGVTAKPYDILIVRTTYGCEAWTLTNRDEKHLRIFERRILRRIFGPVQNEDGSWRIKMNYELNELIGNADIVRFIKK